MFAKRHITLSLILSIVSLSLLQPIVHGNHGLEWGISVGDTFYFVEEIETEDESDSSEFVMEIAELPEIPNPIPSMYDLPMAEAMFHFEDGSSTYGYEIGLSFLNTILVGFPIGNWTLLTILMEEFVENLESNNDIMVENTETHWTITHNAIGIIFDYIIVISLLKSDGILSYINYEQWLGSSRRALITITRTNPPTDPANDFTIIIVGVGGLCVIAILIIILILKKRSKHEP